MKIVHISDTHGAKYHTKLEIPECDVLIHSGDIGGRTTTFDLVEFLQWFEQQPAKAKIFIAGNHDLCLDAKYNLKEKDKGNTYGWLKWAEEYQKAVEIIKAYPTITYLNNQEFTYEDIKFYGSPYSPSFHKEHWAFNADRGQEINKQWGKIPKDVNVLITHTPIYNILDDVREYKQENEFNSHAGCKDLLNVIRKRLFKLSLHCCGHIHDNLGVIQVPISQSRKILCSNGAVLNNRYEHLIFKPLIINL